ncbi:hypothetical protein PSTG_03052 [Puccinia striiformis f. sp. tritici PST-78]|uniref:Nucleoside diphosphate kinase n=1 Tax=Puccinia striiformis f. sp. tritici PST-78 TaxID=1165861 RepID=A0A0L0VXG6_9BASI|nr:hypothetical protein PSTG_03052 [Puccinia striiformis f. sp. tritici PST-78]
MPLLNIRLPSSWHLHQSTKNEELGSSSKTSKKNKKNKHQQQQNQEQEQEHQEQQEQTESTPAAEEQTRLPTPPPSPLPNELTIAIIQPNQQANIQSTIEARLASTGFKIIEQQAIQLTTNNNHSLTGLSTGHHLIYLLSRSRAIQAWKDLVGFDLPARPGSLRFIFGNQAVWAAENNQLVYDLIHRFWKGSVHLNHPNFTLLSPTFPPQQSPSSTHEPSSPPRQEKRVFKFSKSTPTGKPSPTRALPSLPPDSPSPQQESEEDDHSQDEERSDLITTTSTTTATTTTNDEFRSSYKRHSKIPRNTSLSSSSINSSLISHSTDFSPSSSTTTTTTTSAATATGLNHTKTSSLEVNNQVSEGSSSNNKLHPPSIQRPSSRSSSSSTLASSSVDSTMSNNRRSSITQSAVQSMGKTSSATGATKTQEPAPYTFKARPVPASVTEPIGALSPKMSKAAMLRLGLAWTPPVRSIPSTNSTLSSSTSSTVVTPTRYAPVASLNPPTVQPRHTKASALRTHGTTSVDPSSSSPDNTKKVNRIKKTQSQIFENTPGHKRINLHTNIPSCAAPKTVPRHTKASALRTHGTTSVDPSSSLPDHTKKVNRIKKTQSQIFENTPGHKRTNLHTNIPSCAAPKTVPRHTKASALRTGGSALLESLSTSSSTTNTSGPNPLKISAGRKSGDFYHGVPGHKRTEKISVEATKRPEIEPRMTKTSLLRMGVPSAPTTSSTTTKPGPKPDNSKGGHISRPSVDSGDSHTSVNHEDQASVDYSSEIETEIDTEIEVDHPGHAVTLPIDLSCSVRSSSATKGSSLIPTTTSSASNHSSNHSSRIPHNQRFGSAIIRK